MAKDLKLENYLISIFSSLLINWVPQDSCFNKILLPMVIFKLEIAIFISLTTNCLSNLYFAILHCLNKIK